MALKTFHIIFIIASTLLSFGFAAWAFWYCARMHTNFYCVMGAGSVLLGITLIIYGNSFFKELARLN